MATPYSALVEFPFWWLGCGNEKRSGVVMDGAAISQTLCEEMISSGDTYRAEREITPAFLETVGSWIDASPEVLVVLRYLRAGGAKDYSFVRTRKEFAALVECLPEGTDIIVFEEPQLPIRGTVDSAFLANARTRFRDGEEYLFVRLRPEKKGDLRLFGEMGGSHAEMAEDLSEEEGEQVAIGLCPSFISPDNERMISAAKGGIDGPR